MKRHNNPLPEGAKWLLVSEGVKDKTERVKTYRVDYMDRIYDEITVIDVNDATMKHQNVTINGDTLFSGNQSTTYGGGGIYVKSGKKFKIEDSTIIENKACYGGGIYAQPTDGADAVNVVISNNTADKDGGGVFTQQAEYGWSIVFKDSTIINNNSGANGGGIYSNCRDSYTNCTISNNSTKGSGGAIYNDGTVRFVNCELTGNHADNRGGGYCCEYKATGYMEGGSMNGNTAPLGANDYDPYHHFWITNGGNVNGRAFY